MTPPTFSDLNKSVKDLFEKFFNLGNAKFECKTKTANGYDLLVGGNNDYLLGSASGLLKLKYESQSKGFSIQQKFVTLNKVITTEFVTGDTLIKGLNQTFELIFKPPTGSKTANSKTNFKRDNVNLNFDLNFTSQMPKINTSLVVGLLENSLLGGVNLGFDIAAGQEKQLRLTKDCYALSYQSKDLQVCAQLGNRRSDYEASVFQRVPGSRVEAGAIVGWSQVTHFTKFALCGRWKCLKSSVVKAKVDNNALLGLAYSVALDEGVTITLSSEIDVKNLDNAGHRLGLILEYDH